MKILAGIHRADSGEIRIDGAPIVLHASGRRREERHRGHPPGARGHRHARRCRQRVPGSRAADGRAAAVARSPAMDIETARQLSRVGVGLAARTLDAPVVHRAAATRGHCPRSLDERAPPDPRRADVQPHRRATPNGCLHVLRDLRANGTGIVYISHRLEEVEALADRAVVLRDGCNAGTLTRGEMTRDRLVQLMVGRALGRERATARRRPRSVLRGCRSRGCAPAATRKSMSR